MVAFPTEKVDEVYDLKLWPCGACIRRYFFKSQQIFECPSFRTLGVIENPENHIRDSIEEYSDESIFELAARTTSTSENIIVRKTISRINPCGKDKNLLTILNTNR